MNLRVGISQFPVSQNLNSNFEFICQHIREAAGKKCDIIQFPECALSGYAGVDFPDLKDFDWALLDKLTEEIQSLANDLKIRIILGTSFLDNKNLKPFNSLYAIDENGGIQERYDKRFCAGGTEGGIDDLKHYRSGNHFSIFKVKGITCSMLICHDYRYPELYRELAKRNVQMVFHSFHAGNIPSEKFEKMKFPFAKNHSLNISDNIPTQTMIASIISYAANNYMFISCSNTSAKESCWGAFLVRPDGFISNSAERNNTQVLIADIDFEEQLYDSTKAWRKNALEGILHSGKNDRYDV
ncbi:carbon-nitrogen hydrolase family protein [Gramella sp. KN1008]|uniref:carbon-nitrogen hydrolase family protein n=1 Tax=Gramella sp. KN1008 TaxID=2529298 RepID=UPI00103C6B76|nr:carbon-nitrogen hydrolase family protein [Gramella sp. KN1008]TBW26567.1 carbon-nitrogen hydrolase family protein [Gramella sp. KN1008]